MLIPAHTKYCCQACQVLVMVFVPTVIAHAHRDSWRALWSPQPAPDHTWWWDLQWQCLLSATVVHWYSHTAVLHWVVTQNVPNAHWIMVHQWTQIVTTTKLAIRSSYVSPSHVLEQTCWTDSLQATCCSWIHLKSENVSQLFLWPSWDRMPN